MYVRSACGNCIVVAELVDGMERGTWILIRRAMDFRSREEKIVEVGKNWSKVALDCVDYCISLYV